jgi:hypothetical protein
LVGSTIRGTPDHRRQAKKKSTRSSIARPSPPVPVHDRDRSQVGRRDRQPDLFGGFADGGGEHRLALLDMSGRGGRPMTVQVPGARAELQQHLTFVTEQHVGSRHDPESLHARKPRA